VALVVGDIVGHGLHASATMGRLRTAVRTLADIDLPPDELLTHLDDLVARLSTELESDQPAGRYPETGGEVGATCCTPCTTRSPAAAHSPGRDTRYRSW
jgi:hypothetical protein